MADPAALVSDTHPLIFHAAGGSRLGRRGARHFAACERQEALLYVPVPVIWEIGLLARRGRIRLPGSLSEFFDDLFSNPAYQPVELTPEHVYLADELRPNEDPFDALICSVARTLDLPLLTADTEIEDSGIVAVAW